MTCERTVENEPKMVKYADRSSTERSAWTRSRTDMRTIWAELGKHPTGQQSRFGLIVFLHAIMSSFECPISVFLGPNRKAVPT